jgi:hypothetical protein
LLGPIRRTPFLDDGLEPMPGCGVCPRGPWGAKAPLGMGGEADGVWSLM